MTARLVTLHVSPFSERARWALDHHGIAYRVDPHTPFLGEPRLRRLVAKARTPRPQRAVYPLLAGGWEA